MNKIEIRDVVKTYDGKKNILEGISLDVREGDTVQLFAPGRGADDLEPTADDWAANASTINYVIYTCLRNRIPRLYLHARDVLSESDLALMDPRSILS